MGYYFLMPDKVYLSQDDGSVSAFSISTPRKEEGETVSPPVDVGPADSAVEIPLSQPPAQIFDTPSSIATSASNFLRQFNEVAELAATLNETDETAEIAAPDIAIPLASIEPREQPTGGKQGQSPKSTEEPSSKVTPPPSSEHKGDKNRKSTEEGEG